MKARGEEGLLERVAALLDEPRHAEHPLREALEELYLKYRDQQEQLDRLMNISDRYQALAREAQQVTQQRYERALKRQKKLSRISDRYQALMRERNQTLHQEAHHDALTELPNRRLIDERLAQLDQSGRRYTLALLDIDHFKQVNDEHGHDVGDELLVAITRTMRQGLRDHDLCGRWGGEEFLLLLGDTALDEASRIVERLRARLAQVRVPSGDRWLSVTLSAGLSQHRDGEAYLTTLQRADQALLEAKREGRDRSQLATR
ncbi:GGDEF domain-containing protein [Bisbaumannia pacifica]|uniref:diguanylate cyclase n=1 Tax=Bisbaumannia pacifica TaxID=77098 RepID=A0A510X7A4_9GAMM|nr:biofilm regulation diguanylate cyclase SiaD [Halomonas pacifica]GEK46335.1 GGDEF domain-containing protein [Halomonas pacifica]